MKKYIIYIIASILSLGILNAQDFDRDAMPKAGPTPSINITQPETFVLDNGLTVMVVENHKLPRVNVTLSADQPPLYEGNIVGVGQVLGDQLGNGTTNMSKDDFNSRIDFLGAYLTFGSSGGYANMLSKYFDEVMGMMSDAVLNPLFAAEEVEKTKEQMIEGLKVEEKSAEAIAGNVYPALTYGKNTALGEFTTEENIKQITTADVEKYYKKYYSPENYYLVVVGDVTVDKVKAVIADGLAKWEKSTDNARLPLKPAQNLETAEINIVNVPSAVQSVIKVGNLHELGKNDKDYFAARIANYILGGGALDSRLNMNLREKNAFTYGAYANFSTGKYHKEFSASTNVRNEVTAAAVKEIMKELEGITTISDDDLKDAKAKLKGQFIMSLEQPSTIANFALNKAIYDLPDSYYQNYLKSLDAVTKEDVKNAVQKYIKPNKTRIFIVGKALDFLPELEKLGYPIHFYDKDAMPTAKPEKKEVANDVTPATVAEKYIQAIGGKEVAEKITSIKMTSVAKVQGMELQSVTLAANGPKMMVDISMMGNTVQKIVFDGTEGYIMAQGQKMPLPEDAKAEMLKSKVVIPELMYANNSELELTGIETIKDEEAYALKNGNTVTYYSVATGLKVAEITTKKAPNGQEVASPTYYSDYKEVEGVKMPFKLTQDMMGQEIVFDVQSYDFNTAKDEDFK
ncbi:putative Zn-dependent peptidase [Balneicella halophila]|uniref:Putative Zn-dependent peptidase n=1 Tax=Balneicella halophila TaxID=1537566 RepID=A0A7L4UQ94_BALHA|nr:pitrilysin family protein [Balneicella halophila]PVX51057.1 putative Zn-dependent peptidase [Balneicella halophila]